MKRSVRFSYFCVQTWKLGLFIPNIEKNCNICNFLKFFLAVFIFWLLIIWIWPKWVSVAVKLNVYLLIKYIINTLVSINNCSFICCYSIFLCNKLLLGLMLNYLLTAKARILTPHIIRLYKLVVYLVYLQKMLIVETEQ